MLTSGSPVPTPVKPTVTARQMDGFRREVSSYGDSVRSISQVRSGAGGSGTFSNFDPLNAFGSAPPRGISLGRSSMITVGSVSASYAMSAGLSKYMRNQHRFVLGSTRGFRRRAPSRFLTYDDRLENYRLRRISWR